MQAKQKQAEAEPEAETENVMSTTNLAELATQKLDT